MTFSWQAADGTVFSGEQWTPAGAPRGRLICVHGLGGAATDFIPLAQAAAARGFSTFALNLRGQGCDPEESRRGRFLDPDVLTRDLAAFVASLPASTVPVFLCGESVGALLVAASLGRQSSASPIRGAIFSVPVVDLKKPTPKAVRWTLQVAAGLFPTLRLDPSRFVSRKPGRKSRLRVTRDEAYEEILRSAPHRIPAFSVAVLHAFGKFMDDRKNLAAGVTIPTLVLAAGQDAYIRPDQVRAWFDLLPNPDKEYREYPEAFHLLWNDLDHEAVLADIFAWLEARCPSP